MTVGRQDEPVDSPEPRAGATEDQAQVAALIRIAQAIERLTEVIESNHRGGRGVFDAGRRP